MPLARFQLRNEYGLGAKELYREPSEIEDPKLVLDGVAVAGLVGLLRQLGDLAELAAEVFHGLQEELTRTASKSRKLITRVKDVEAALPPIEKAILSQTSHIHFAYAPGSDWHARIRNEQNHFIYTYLPRCIMDPYEECREPPRLQLLDKFDVGGPGSCLKRYSDPTFFRKWSGNSDINDEKYHKGRKSRKSKRRRAKKRSSQLPISAPNFDSDDRPKVSLSLKPQQSSPVHTSSTYDMTVKSDLVVQPGSPSSGDGMGFIECVFHPSTSEPNKTKIVLPLSVLDDRMTNNPNSNYVDEQTSDIHDKVQETSTMEENTHHASSVTWDEKVEIVEPMVLFSGLEDDPSLNKTSSEFDKQEIVPSSWKSVDGEATEVNNPYFDYDEPDIEPMKLTFESYEATEVHSTSFQLNLENGRADHTYGRNEISKECENFEPDDLESVSSGQISWDNGISQLSKSLEYDQQEMDPVVGEILDLVGTSPNVPLDKIQPDDIESETDNFVDALNAIESDSEKDHDWQTRREVVPYTHLKDDLDNKNIAGNNDDHLLELESPSSPYQDFNQTSFNTLHNSTSSVLSTCKDSFQHSTASLDASEKELCVLNADDLVSPLELAHNAPFQTVPSSLIQHFSCRNKSGIPDDITDTLQQLSDAGIPDSLQQSDFGINDSLQQQSDLGIPDDITDTLQQQSDLVIPDGITDSLQQQSDLGIPEDITNSLQQYSDVGESFSQTKETGMIAESGKGTIFTPVSQQAPVDYRNVNFVALWTNGGLLGLQPSKPPDFKTSDCPGIGTRNSASHSYQSLIPNDDDLQEKLDLSRMQLNCEDKNANSHEPSIDSSAHEIGFSKVVSQFSNSGLDGKLANPIQSDQTNFMPSLTHPETQYPSAFVARVRSNGTVHANEDGGLLTDGLERTGSAEHDEKPKDLNELTSPLSSPPPSPPLEHMKISFQPFNSFETFKLKLKYPEGIDHHDENVNVYPSFQLVPEPNHLHRTTMSDSDDDTFCRSNLCMSDDDLSYLSDSVWGSGDSSESLDDRRYDGLQRIPYDELVSSSGEHGNMATKKMHNIFESNELEYKIGLSHVNSGPISNIPVLSVMSSTSYQETNFSSDAPPLPPVQWRASDSLSYTVTIGSESTPFNDLSSFSLCKNSRSACSRIPNLEPDRLDHSRNQAAGRSVDENEDFLQQIRTTSLNLRKTGLLTPTCTSTPPSSHVNVTTILQKASAIRKVVASDGEDTEPWSDT